MIYIYIYRGRFISRAGVGGVLVGSVGARLSPRCRQVNRRSGPETGRVVTARPGPVSSSRSWAFYLTASHLSVISKGMTLRQIEKKKSTENQQKQ